MRTASWLLILPLLTGLTASRAQHIAVGSYAVPKGLIGTAGITTGPDHALWFTGYWGNSIGRITTSGEMKEFALPTALSWPWGITEGPDHSLWFTETRNNKIGRITTSGAITEYLVPTEYVTPWAIASGPDGALWFTENSGNVGRVTTDGVVTEFPLPPSTDGYPNGPYGIVAGPDGALWFALQGANCIGRITTKGDVTEYPLPNAHSDPDFITVGPDGALWFTEEGGDRIGRITTAGAITEFSTSVSPIGITTGPDNALWFTQDFGGVGRITTSGSITLYSTPVAPNQPGSIISGPDGELWFVEDQGIGQAVFVTAGLEVTPTAGHFPASLLFSGSGFAPSEKVEIYTGGVGSPALATGTADSTGSFQVAATAPPSGYGPRFFLGVGQNSGKLGAAGFSMMPSLLLSTDSGTPGSTVTVSGYGFDTSLNPDDVSFGQINIYWNNPRTLMGTVEPNFHGSVVGDGSFTFTVPSTTPAGPNGIIAWGPPAVASIPFTVQ
jgi:virginiamycin B lyase